VKDPEINLARAKQLAILKHGIDAETGRKVSRLLKDSKLKVQAQNPGREGAGHRQKARRLAGKPLRSCARRNSGSRCNSTIFETEQKTDGELSPAGSTQRADGRAPGISPASSQASFARRRRFPNLRVVEHLAPRRHCTHFDAVFDDPERALGRLHFFLGKIRRMRIEPCTNVGFRHSRRQVTTGAEGRIALAPAAILAGSKT